MGILKNENKDFVSDIDYHFNEIEIDLLRAKFDNKQNSYLTRLFDSVLTRINFLKEIIVSEPRAYFNTIFSEMKRLYSLAKGDLDGFTIVISFKKNPNSEKMGLIKLLIEEKILDDE